MEQFLDFDARLSQYFELSLESKWWPWARFTAHLGDGHYVFGSLGFVYLIGWLWDALYLRQATSAIGLTILMSMLAIAVIKHIVRRERPQPPGEFVAFKYDAYSFPSGHSARLMALAVSTGAFAPGFGWVLVVVALGVAIARVSVGIHYLVDIIGGLIVGTLVALVVLMILWPALVIPVL